jgi:hypothetical protein
MLRAPKKAGRCRGNMHRQRDGRAAPRHRNPAQRRHIVASASLYGGTINLLAHTMPRFGITTTFVKPRVLDEFRAARLVFDSVAQSLNPTHQRRNNLAISEGRSHR